MNDSIKGALIGAIIPTAASFIIFFAGNFSTQAALEQATVKNYQTIEIESARPVGLNTLKITNADRFEQRFEISTDTIGNAYSPENLFHIRANGWSGENGYTDFFIGGKYKKLVGEIEIYADEK